MVAVADNLRDAVREAYEKASRITFRDAYMRRDIGARALSALGRME